MLPKRRILIVDDHPLVRAGLTALIQAEPDLEVCGETGTFDGALELFRKRAPDLAINDGMLHLSAPPRSAGHQTAIDFFLRSLAHAYEERAVGIILSGTGSHGTLGLQAIRGHGGLAVVQDPASAEYDQMACSTIAAGLGCAGPGSAGPGSGLAFGARCMVIPRVCAGNPADARQKT